MWRVGEAVGRRGTIMGRGSTIVGGIGYNSWRCGCRVGGKRGWEKEEEGRRSGRQLERKIK